MKDKRNHLAKRRHYISKALLITGAVILIVLAVLVIYHDFKPELELLIHYNDEASRAKLMQLIRAHSGRDMFLMLVVIALMSAIPGVSNSVVCIFTGVCYGPLVGFLINWIGDILGNCIVAGLITRIHFSDKFRNRPVLKRLMKAKHPQVALTMAYMIPIIPCALVNYASVQLKIDRKQYLTMIGLGMFPSACLYAFGGDAIMKGNIKRIIIIALIIVSAVIIYKLVDSSTNED